MENNKPEASKFQAYREYLEFLDNLRELGITNMFGARPYLMSTFNLDKQEASSILSFWMQTYSQRHQ